MTKKTTSSEGDGGEKVSLSPLKLKEALSGLLSIPILKPPNQSTESQT